MKVDLTFIYKNKCKILPENMKKKFQKQLKLPKKFLTFVGVARVCLFNNFVKLILPKVGGVRYVTISFSS